MYNKDLSNRPIYSVLNAHNLDMILRLKYTYAGQNCLERLEILEMLWSVMCLIFKTISVTLNVF